MHHTVAEWDCRSERVIFSMGFWVGLYCLRCFFFFFDDDDFLLDDDGTLPGLLESESELERCFM